MNLDWHTIDTVLLDMDGTLLDLYYDNHFWREHVPMRFAEKQKISLDQAKQLISGHRIEPEVGAFYNGVVKRIIEIGAFVEIMPGTDGLLHISEISKDRIRAVEDVLTEGDEVVVKCIKVDRDGKIRLSRREVLDANPPAEEIHNFVV